MFIPSCYFIQFYSLFQIHRPLVPSSVPTGSGSRPSSQARSFVQAKMQSRVALLRAKTRRPVDSRKTHDMVLVEHVQAFDIE